MTSRNGTTLTEEIPVVLFSMQHCVKEYILFLVKYISKYEYYLKLVMIVEIY